MTVPANAPADVHAIVAVARDEEDRVVGQKSAPFTIAGAPGSSGNGTADAPGGAQETSGATDRNASGGESGEAGRGAATARGGDSETTVNGGETRPDTAPDNQATTTLSSGDSVFADSVGSGPAVGASERSAAGSSPAASRRSAAADLWAGFDSRSAPGFLDERSGSNEPSSLPGATAVLLALGMTAGLGGLVLAASRRRRRALRN